jgi:hypothetical protein
MRGLATALEQAHEQPGAVVFHDRAELLAAFLAALAEGSAWSRWWFDEFDGLKPLGASAAIRTAVIDAGETGIAALARLTEGAACQVLRTLSAGDAARVLAAIEQRQQWAIAAPFALWSLSEALARERAAEASVLLHAVVAAERSSPGSAGPATIAALRAMRRLRELGARGAFNRGAHAAAGILNSGAAAAGMLAALRVIAQHHKVPAEWLDRMSEPEIAAVFGQLEALAGSLPASEARAARTPQHTAGTAAPAEAATRYGGIFVLIKVMDALGWIERWRLAAAEKLSEREANNFVRALVLEVSARALAPRVVQLVTNDPALTLAFDVAGRSWREHAALARRVLRATGAPAAALLLKSLGERIVGLAGSSPSYLRRNALCLHATVQRDEERVCAVLGRAPLDVLLTLSGARRGSVALPGGPRIEMREAGA